MLLMKSCRCNFIDNKDELGAFYQGCLPVVGDGLILREMAKLHPSVCDNH